MDWRIVVAGFVVSVGFGLGYAKFGTVSAGVVSAVLVAGLFLVDWLIDARIYRL
ncbi:hypothetical protein [Halorussus amylolyticus]|uniref:hypothetical protein n=1 Tax=Halorussus amylolyticus TaxID=1126242 RepID=UPI00138F630E|nr:hypothetical protein [Halorussus amylolyticus]